jgi:hypothetical protein
VNLVLAEDAAVITNSSLVCPCPRAQWFLPNGAEDSYMSFLTLGPSLSSGTIYLVGGRQLDLGLAQFVTFTQMISNLGWLLNSLKT